LIRFNKIHNRGQARLDALARLWKISGPETVLDDQLLAISAPFCEPDIIASTLSAAEVNTIDRYGLEFHH